MCEGMIHALTERNSFAVLSRQNSIIHVMAADAHGGTDAGLRLHRDCRRDVVQVLTPVCFACDLLTHNSAR